MRGWRPTIVKEPRGLDSTEGRAEVPRRLPPKRTAARTLGP